MGVSELRNNGKKKVEELIKRILILEFQEKFLRVSRKKDPCKLFRKLATRVQAKVNRRPERTGFRLP